MGKPVISLALGRMKEPWYELSEEERNDRSAKFQQWRDEEGIRTIIACWSAWSTHQWEWFAVMEFPDIEVLQKHTERCAEVDWLRYMHVMTVLGTKMEQPS